jgi:PST family polysaccharide transporter
MDTVFWMTLCFTAVLATVWILSRSAIASWFHAPALAPYIVVISLAVVVSGIGAVPQSLLQKALRYRDFAIVESAGSLAQAAVSVTLAVGGYGIWSLIWGYFAQETVKTVAFFWYARFTPRLRWSASAATAALRFGLPVLGDRVLSFLTLSSDRAIIGKLLGPAPLGVYVLAIEIASFPGRRVVLVLARVLFPALSELQSDVQRMAQAYQRVARTLSLVLVPAFVGLACVADDLVRVLFGSQWLAVTGPLRLLCLAGVVTALLAPAGSVPYGRGRPDVAFYLSILTALVIPAAIIVGASGGLWYAALAHSLAWAVLLPVMVATQSRLLQLSARSLSKEYAAGIGFAIPVLIAVVTARALASHFDASSAARLAISVGTGLASYLTTVWVFERRGLLSLRRNVAGYDGPRSEGR